MNFIKKYIPVLFVIITIILLLTFKNVPKGHLWKDYTVLYAPANINENIIIQSLETSEISEYICLGNQRVPILLTPNSVEAAMLKLNINSSTSDYLSAREGYFYDLSGKYKLFYIPVAYKDNLDNCIRLLEKNNIKAGIDSDFSYPWLLPLIILLLVIMLLCFSRNKLLFLSECFIPFIYVCTNPFYSSATAIILLFIALFFISNLLGRKGAVKQLFKGIIVIAIFVIAAVSAFSSSPLSGIFFIIMLAGVFSSILIYCNLKEHHESKQHFKPVYIRPAKMISVFGGNGKIVMPLTIVGIIVIIVYFALSSSQTLKTDSSKVFIPGTAELQNPNLPEMEDYFKWNWTVYTAPLKSLNINYSSDEIIDFPSYQNEDGFIKETENVFSFNDVFKQKVYSDIDDLDFNSIEKVIKCQGNDFKCDYVSIGAYNVSLFSIIMMFICFAMLLFIYFSAIIKKGGRK